MRSPHLPFDGRSGLSKAKPKQKERTLLTKVVLVVGGAILVFYAGCTALIFSLRFMDPPTTVVQIQRQISAAYHKRPYNVRSLHVPLNRIAPDLQYAVVSAEDGRFFVHNGFDWLEMKKVVKADLAKHTVGRGASTITQQLVKNLFLGTERSYIKKGVEFTLVPIVEFFLPKNRILELYLNVIEWGPGIFGAEAAAEHWYHVDALHVSRDQAARLAAIIPSPLKRAPAAENEYSEEILQRMKNMGW